MAARRYCLITPLKLICTANKDAFLAGSLPPWESFLCLVITSLSHALLSRNIELAYGVQVRKMTARPKHYFLAPTGNPPEGPIRLGNIISAPRLVDDPINENYVPLSCMPMETFLHNETNYKFQMGLSEGGSVGIWASFLQLVLGIGGQGAIESLDEDSEQWACENLQTISFRPTLAYIVKSLEDEGVRNHIRINKPWFGSSKLYMITGVKVAHGAASTVRYARNKGFNLRFGADFSALGVPVGSGPEFSRNSATSVEQSQGGAEPFVFAFRLRRIKITRKGDILHGQYDKGTFLSSDRNDNNEPREVELLVDGLEDDDADGSEFQLDSMDAVDEGSTTNIHCRIIVSEED